MSLTFQTGGIRPGHGLAFALAYSLAAELGDLLSFPRPIATFWPPSGLFLAVLLLSPRRQWPGYLAIALLVNLIWTSLHGKPLLVGLGFGLARSAEALVTATVILRVFRRGFSLTSLRGTLGFVLVSALVGGPVGALLGAAVGAGGLGLSFFPTGYLWWSSSLIGCLILTPPLLILFQEGGPRWKKNDPRSLWEALATGGFLLLTGEYIFGHQSEALAWAMMPAMLLTAIRYQIRGIVLANLLLTALSLWHTARAQGPFGSQSEWVRLLLVQSFVGIISTSFLAMATVVRERHHGAEQLDQYRQSLESANAELLRLSRTDGLTGVNNRLAFQDRLQEELQFAEMADSAFSMILLDVDHFKAYNDSYGHPEGDLVLRRVAQRMQENVRRRTDFVARYGGEEFAILLPSLAVEEALARAEQLRARIAETDWPLRRVTVSIGVATLGGRTRDATALLRAADDALYASKHAGRNCVHHADHLRHTDTPLLTLG